jgi:hypothetical protein
MATIPSIGSQYRFIASSFRLQSTAETKRKANAIPKSHQIADLWIDIVG